MGFCIYGLSEFVEARRFQGLDSIHTLAKIIYLADSNYCSKKRASCGKATIQFRSLEGKLINLELDDRISKQKYKSGDDIKIIYLAYQPENIRLERGAAWWLKAAVFGGFGLLVLFSKDEKFKINFKL